MLPMTTAVVFETSAKSPRVLTKELPIWAKGSNNFFIRKRKHPRISFNVGKKKKNSTVLRF